MRAPKGGGRKQLPVCHLCGREFGTASLQIHLKACAAKYEREKGKPAPSAPEMLNQLTSGERPVTSKDWEAYNEAAHSAAEGEMEPCPICGRTFASKERLAVHMRSCDGSRPAPAKAKTARDVPAASSSAAAAAAPAAARGGGGDVSKSRGATAKAATAREAPTPKPPRSASPKPSLLRRMSSGSLFGKGKATPREEPSKPTAPSAGSGEGRSAKERMMELKELLEAGLINQDEYDAKRLQIIQAL